MATRKAKQPKAKQNGAPPERVDFRQQQYELVAIDTLHEHPENPNKGDVEIIDESIAENGFYGAVYAQRSTRRVIAGNHRHRQLKAKGEKTIPVIWLDVDDARALKILLIDNAARDEATYDLPKLDEILRQLIGDARGNEAIDAALKGTGFDALRVDNIMQEIEQLKVKADAEDDDAEEKTAIGSTFSVYRKQQILDHSFKFFRDLPDFPYPDVALHEQLQQINALHDLPDGRAWNTRLGYRVADTYHRHRFSCAATGARSPLHCFRDPKCLRHSLQLALDNDKRITQTFPSELIISHGTQACANFRPGVAMALIRKYSAKGGRVLDPCHGFGGRLVGWIAAAMGGTYVGVDPSSLSHDSNVRMAKALGVSDRVVLLKQPFEDVTVKQLGGARSCSFALTSPPYFAKEAYSDEATQSSARYKTPDIWREKFLRPLIANVQQALKPGAHFALNIADVKMGKLKVPLEAWSVDDAKAVGFTLIERVPMSINRRVGAGHDAAEDVDEPVFIFRNGGKRT